MAGEEANGLMEHLWCGDFARFRVAGGDGRLASSPLFACALVLRAGAWRRGRLFIPKLVARRGQSGGLSA